MTETNKNKAICQSGSGNLPISFLLFPNAHSTESLRVRLRMVAIQKQEASYPGISFPSMPVAFVIMTPYQSAIAAYKIYHLGCTYQAMHLFPATLIWYIVHLYTEPAGATKPFCCVIMGGFY